MVSFASRITDLEEPVFRQLLLNHEVPVLVVQVLAMPVDRLGTEQLILGVEESCQGEGQRRKIRGRKRVTRHGAFRRIAEVVVLISAVVDTEASANRSLAMQRGRRPRKAQPWPEVLRVWIIVRRALRAEAAAAGNIHHRGAVQNLVNNRVVLVAQTYVQREVGTHLEIVLSVCLIEGPAAAGHALSLQVRGGVRPIVDEIVIGGVGDGRCCEGVAGVVQADAANVDAEL